MELNTALEAIKNKYKDLGLSDKILSGFAAKLSKTATDETLEQLVDDLEPELQIWQSVLDSHRKEISDIKKQIKPVESKKEQKPKTESDEKVDPVPPKNDDTPEWARSLIMEVQGLKSEKLQNSRRSQYESIYKDVKDEKFKANQLSKFERMNFKDDEDFNSFMETETVDVKEFNQAQVNESMKGNPPLGGVNSKEKPTDQQLKEVMTYMTN